jgi:hypothetical protein
VPQPQARRRLLILLQKHAASTGGRRVLRGPAKELFEAFKIVKLEKHLTIKEGAEAALGTFGTRAETRRYALDEQALKAPGADTT